MQQWWRQVAAQGWCEIKFMKKIRFLEGRFEKKMESREKKDVGRQNFFFG